MILSIMVMFSLAVQTMGSYLEDYGKKVSIYGGFSDVANCLANDITTIILTVPHHTEIRYTKEVPSEMGGVIYYVNYSNETLTVYDHSYSEKVHLSGLKWEGDVRLSGVSAGVVVLDVKR